MWEDLEKERIKRIVQSLTIAGAISLLLISFMLLSRFQPVSFQFSAFFAIFMGATLLAYLSYSKAISATPVYTTVRPSDFIWLTILHLFVAGLVYVTGSYLSTAKLFFVILVAVYGIRYGRRLAIVSATFSSLCIVLIDILYLQGTTYNPYLEQDIITIAVIWIVGWIISDLNETENQIRDYLTKLTQMDELTGLLNHRAFQESLSKALEKVGTTYQTLSLVIADIDNFKEFNDLYGHQQGDKVLKRIAHELQETFVAPAISARFGGDEFAVIIPDAETGTCSEITDTFRKKVESLNFEEVTPSFKITITAGITTARSKVRREEIVRMADMALFKGKNTARNRVELYHSVLEELKTEIGSSDEALVNTIRTLLAIINAKDKYTYGHSERLVDYATQIGRCLGLSWEEIRTLRYGAFLHDIGKVEIPDAILNKQGPLTAQEWEVMKKHPIWGANIVAPLKVLSDSIPLILYHHERWDGTGYPQGLKGDQIPFGARVLNLLDAFDAMSMDRPYQKRKDLNQILDEIMKCSGTCFDPSLAAKFVEYMKKGFIGPSLVFPVDTIS